MASYVRRDFQGAAVATTISSGINNSTTSIPITASTGWPDGTNGNFLVVIDRGLSTEEKVLCSARVSLTLTAVSSVGRGADGTSAVAHSSGAAIEHCIGKLDADEANYAVAQTVGKVTTSQDLIVASAANTFARLAVGAGDTYLGSNAGTVAWRAQSTIDHGSIGGLTDDDHTQYPLKSILTTKGDLLAATAASTPARVAVGADGLPLVANSAASTGVGYAALAAAGIAADAVTTVKILDANVTAAKLASSAVTAGKIATGGISAAAQFAAGVVDAAAIATDAVDTAEIKASAVTADELAADAVTTVKILDANVTAAKIASEAWTSYTPTLGGTSAALGNGTLVAAWQRHGRIVHARIIIQAGSTTNLSSTSLTLTLPVAAVDPGDYPQAVGPAHMNDASSAFYTGIAYIDHANDTGNQKIRVAWETAGNINATVPFTWGAGDQLSIMVCFEAAS